jgi:hypothetical protein
MKIKYVCASKDTIKKAKSQPTEWEKYLQIIPRICAQDI